MDFILLKRQFQGNFEEHLHEGYGRKDFTFGSAVNPNEIDDIKFSLGEPSVNLPPDVIIDIMVAMFSPTQLRDWFKEEFSKKCISSSPLDDY